MRFGGRHNYKHIRDEREIEMLRLILVLLLSMAIGADAGEGKKKYDQGKQDDPASLPNLDLDSFYYETALTPTAAEGGEATILASTIDGTLVALNGFTGEIIWHLNDEPVVKSPYDPTKPVLPAFLPDPKDGSLYMIGGGLKDPLKKLPFTIPELVASSPCKSSDGILYTGKKVDTWFSVDRHTGDKQGAISFNGCVDGMDGQCPNLKPANFLIGRTEYNIMMYDSRAQGKRWNISFFDYSSNLGAPDIGNDYDLAHFTDSSAGTLVTLDRKSGNIQWEKNIGSPIVAMYKLEGEGIVSVPFTSVSKETLGNLLEQFNAPESTNEIIGETKLFPTLYVGEHDHGLYAMPSLVDEQTLTISPAKNGPLLLEGPPNFPMPPEIDIEVITGNQGAKVDPLGIPMDPESMPKDSKSSVLLFGYYQVPEQSSTIKLTPAVTQLQLTSTSIGAHRSSTGGIIPPMFTPGHQHHPTGLRPSTTYPSSPRNDSDEDEEVYGYDIVIVREGAEQLKNLNTTFILSGDFVRFCGELLPMVKESLMAIENKELKIIVILLFVGVLVLFRLLKSYNQRNSPLSISSMMSNSSVGASSSGQITAVPVELENGHVKVGNLTFDPQNILGKGCEGTFVYRGRFDNRDVAVKRVLAACFSIAAREVALLRESDEHPNVIRYFCTEQDRQFQYIALELCAGTLQEYVEGKYSAPAKLDPLTILRQATQGLNHLHNLDIVHRDIKPQNVLISQPGSKGDVRAMISDFGLCKKLKVGRMSFSRRSGVAGTEGWIAPEMMLGHRSNTCAVDIFSLGCVFYFVLSKGSHPFGESFRRQANILSGESDLSSLTEVNTTARSLIEKMISGEQTIRPPTSAVLKHPLFWSKERVLGYLQDLSDRVDTEDYDSAILQSLERNKFEIVRGNWHDVLDPVVREDLRKHRTYNGKSVRDLLRALRNKKHHYNELPETIKAMYGRIPDEFVNYWTSRFPKLLIHSWSAMHCIKNEPTFAKYFDKNYDFLQTHYRQNLSSLAPKGLSTSVNPNNGHFNLFQPSFMRNDDAESDNDDIAEVSHSSVVSNWANIDTDDSPGKPFLSVNDQDDTSQSQRGKFDPFLLTESPLQIENKPANDQNQSHLAMRRNVVAQLNSESRDNYLERREARKAVLKPTFSEALQNISAEDKLNGECDRREICDPLVEVEEGGEENNAARIKAIPEREQPSDTERTPNGEEGANAQEQDDNPVTKHLLEEENHGGKVKDDGSNAVWILPPTATAENKKKKNKKSKKKQKS